MIGQKLASESRSIQITMQFLLWDFFRELGEKEVAGQEMLKNLHHNQDDTQPDYNDRDGSAVDLNKLHHFAWAYAWWIAKGALPITVLKVYFVSFSSIITAVNFHIYTQMLSISALASWLER
jgi:nucleolar MIF4G domain-containing protein 1